MSYSSTSDTSSQLSEEKCIQATPDTEDKYIQVTPVTEDKYIQAMPVTVERYTQANISTYYSQIKTTAQLSSCTGINSFDVFDAVCVGAQNYIETYIPTYGSKKCLSIRDEVLLTLMKLKLNCSFIFLSTLFYISDRTCSRTFRRMIVILSRTLKHFIVCSSRETIQNNMPSCFSAYTLVKYVLDCTEFPVCKPACIRCRTQTFSYYKGRHTLKVLIGASPDGLITYVSPLFGGKASDKHIFVKSPLLDNCQPSDCIMVDKGFLIEDECEERGVSLIRPAFKRGGRQLSREDCESSRDIASARVHVERVMERLKNFNILKDEIQWNYLGYMNYILLTISGLVNLSPPLLATDKFM